jgi:hypothetical protein
VGVEVEEVEEVYRLCLGVRSMKRMEETASE